jgi:GTP-binding protein
MALVDEIILHACSGKGGDGRVAWHRNRRIQKGGPAGGDGGRGADVYLRGVRDVGRLSKYTSNPKFKAQDGGDGGQKSLEGKDGDDFHIAVPVGSVVTNLMTKDVYEVVSDGETIKVLSGGRGGFGNEHFKSSRNVTPMEHTDGKDAECADFRVELRLIAAAGFIGYPNAGKSTLLNELTNSKAKIGNYAFTTLDPNLGIFDDYVLADIPGLIEGASGGKGLGGKFLKHIMRTNILIHCISAENDSIKDAYKTIRKELGEYNATLLEKKELLIITKSDTVDGKELNTKLKEAKKLNATAIAVSILDDQALLLLQKSIREVLILPE